MTTVPSTAPARGGPAITISGSIAIAVGLAAVSYEHILSFATDAGAEVWEAVIIAATVDSLIIMAISTMAVARRRGVPVPAVAVVALMVGVVATTGANLYDGIEHGWMGIATSVWVPTAALLAEQLASWVIRQGQTTRPATAATAAPDTPTVEADTDTAPDPTPANTRPAPTTAPAGRHDTGQVVPLHTLTDRDRAVLAMLQEDPTIPGAEIGRRLGATERTGQRALTRVQEILARQTQQRTAPTPDTGDVAVGQGDASLSGSRVAATVG